MVMYMVSDRLLKSFKEEEIIKTIRDNSKLLSDLAHVRLGRDEPIFDIKTNWLAFIDATDYYIAKSLLLEPENLEYVSLDEYRNNLYKIFLDNPKIAYDSILFKQKIAKLFFTEEQYENIRKYKLEKTKDISTRYFTVIKTPGKTVDEDILRYAIYSIDDKSMTNFLEGLYQYLLQNPLVNETYYGKEFILKYSSYLLSNKLGVPSSSIYVCNDNFWGEKISKNDFAINCGTSGVISVHRDPLLKGELLQNNLPLLYNALMIIAHDTVHTAQSYNMTEKMISELGFDKLRTSIFKKYLSSDSYDEYSANYQGNEMENMADAIGWDFTYQMISKYNPDAIDNIKEILAARMRTSLEKITVAKYNKTNDKREVAWQYNVKMMDDIMEAHPELLDYSLMLKIPYNNDATRKDLISLLETENNSDNKTEVSKILNDYYLYAINNNELDKININSLTEDKQIMLIKKIAILLTKEYKNAKDMIELCGNRQVKFNIDIEDFSLSSKERKKLIDKMKEYLTGNLSLIQDLIEKDIQLGNKYLLDKTFEDMEQAKKDLAKVLGRASKMAEDTRGGR